MTYSFVVLLLLLTCCCYGITSTTRWFSKNYDWKLKARCFVPHLFPFKTNLCPIVRRNLNHQSRAEDLDLKKLRSFQFRKLKADEEDEDDIELTEKDLPEAPLLAFRIIGCGMVTILVGITIIVYVTSSMFFPDSLSQICSEVCLLAAYTCVLLNTTDNLRIDSGFCIGVSIFLHFTFMAYFLFSLLEVICMVRLLFERFPKYIFPSIQSILIVGWGVPLAVTIISAATLYNQYTARNNCWLNLSKAAFWPSVIPVAICVGIQLLLLIGIIMVDEVPYMLPQQDYDRARCFMTTRWASAIIILMAISAWSMGVIATHKNHEGFFAAFTVSSILLGSVILILRISTDPLVRRVITINLLNLIGKPNRNQVKNWPVKVLKAKEGVSRDKKGPVTEIRETLNGKNQQTITGHR